MVETRASTVLIASALVAGCFNPGKPDASPSTGTIGLSDESTGAATTQAPTSAASTEPMADSSGTSGTSGGESCGDGICDGASEDCSSCAADCGSCPARCGDACGDVTDCPADAEAVCVAQTCACVCDDADACLPCVVEHPIADEGPRVYTIFLEASDAPAELTASRRAAIDRALRGMQDFFADALGPTSGPRIFRAEPVRVWPSPYTTAQWVEFGAGGFTYPDGTIAADCSMYAAAEHLLTTGGLLASHGLPALGSAEARYLVVAGGGANGTCWTGDMFATEFETFFAVPPDTPGTATEFSDIAGRCPTGRADACAIACDGAGLVASGLGGLFGLSAGLSPCTNGPSIMDEPWSYDTGASLCDEERAALAASPFFTAP